MSPEITERKEYNLKADVFSFGVLLYQLTTLKKSHELQVDKKKLEIELKDCDPTLSEIIINSCKYLPNDRMEMEKIHQTLKNSKKELQMYMESKKKVLSKSTSEISLKVKKTESKKKSFLIKPSSAESENEKSELSVSPFKTFFNIFKQKKRKSIKNDEMGKSE
jgi:hypothetical protein